MRLKKRSAAASRASHIVAVIASRGDLEAALRMRRPPDLFELRLDALPNVEPATVGSLGARIIATARDRAEGGARDASARERRALLEQFAQCADYVDLELRSVHSFRSALLSPRTILSLHDFGGTPSVAVLRRKLNLARELGADVFKVATRVDDEWQLERLLQFFDEARDVMPVAAMGMGLLGRRSRIELARRGSFLNYGYITRRQAPGQLSVAELRRLLRR